MRLYLLKTLKISDEVHGKLTAVLGELMAKTGQMKTYQDAMDALLNKSVILPENLLHEIDEFIVENRDLGYVTKEDFLRDAARSKLEDLRGMQKPVGVKSQKLKRRREK
jgi:hypothetical protein